MKFSELTEAIGGKVDATAGIVRGVRILGRTSKNGRRYSDKALESACRLYSDCKVHINHQREEKGERQFETIFAEIKNPVVKGDFVEGDLHYLTKHPIAPQFSEAAEKFPKSFGLSHHAEGTTKREGKDTIVEDVTAVHSVDLVSDPATNNGLFESVAPQYPDAPLMDSDQESAAKAAVGTLLHAAYDEATNEQEFLDKCKALWNLRGAEDEGKPTDAKESIEMKPEDVTKLIETKLAEVTKPLTDKVALLESTNASQAVAMAADKLKLLCLESGIRPTAELLESFKDKDAAFIESKLAEMVKELPASHRPANPPAASTSGNYERVKKELGVNRGAA